MRCGGRGGPQGTAEHRLIGNGRRSRGEGQGLDKALWLQGEEERERLRVWVEDVF